MILGDLIAKQKTESFIDPASASDERALGILVSQHFRWDGAAICEAFAAALTDANFHSEAEAALALVA